MWNTLVLCHTHIAGWLSAGLIGPPLSECRCIPIICRRHNCGSPETPLNVKAICSVFISLSGSTKMSAIPIPAGDVFCRVVTIQANLNNNQVPQ